MTPKGTRTRRQLGRCKSSGRKSPTNAWNELATRAALSGKRMLWSRGGWKPANSGANLAPHSSHERSEARIGRPTTNSATYKVPGWDLASFIRVTRNPNQFRRSSAAPPAPHGVSTAESTVPKRFLAGKFTPRLDDFFAVATLILGQPAFNWGGRKLDIGAFVRGELGD